MPKADIAPYQHNLALKQEFKLLGLDLPEVMEFTPLDLDLENRRLENLLDFVQQYRQYGSREAMEAVAAHYLFPPIFPGIDPDGDWYRFERWMRGEPVRQTLAEQLPETFTIKKPEEISNADIETDLGRLEEALEKAGYGIGLNDGIPPRLVYAFLYEHLGETFELFETDGGGGFWTIDGCSGYCPDCFQRPWCDTGESSCWPEDEEAGKMFLTDVLKNYVSASPKSLDILQRLQAEKDAEFEKFCAENPAPAFGSPERDEDRIAGSN